MKVSIETPVFKGKYLRSTIDSVLQQTCSDWEYSLFWDGGDDESRSILELLKEQNHPRIHIHFSENRGIAHARRFLTEHSTGEYILPLDDDDQICPNAVERYLQYVKQRPWCGIVRAQRGFIDEAGNTVQQKPWFPFERRHFFRGMVKDVFNHCQPYLIQRAAYERTSGWEGFEDFMCAGEDCDIYLKVEEVAAIELLDEVLYHYRINPKRTSLLLTDAAGFEMWRRLADKTIARLGLPLDRVNDSPPFAYRSQPQSPPTLEMVDFWIISSGDDTSDWAIQEHLLGIGVAGQAIHIATADDGQWSDRMAGQERPLACLLSPDLISPSAETIKSILSAMYQQKADLAGPKWVSPVDGKSAGKAIFDDNRLPIVCDKDQEDHVSNASWLPTSMLVMRREVLRATRGWEQAWQHPRLRDAELCLRARARDFNCIFVGSAVASKKIAKAEPSWPPQEARLFQAKWRDYPSLFGSPNVADLSAILSPGLLDNLGSPDG